MSLFRKSAVHPGDPEPEDVPGYRGLRQIGHGGFSVVYRAHQDALDREVALKVVTVPLDADVQRRFLREVMLTGRLTGHPNVVSALDTGLTRSGRPYLAMNLHDHGSLSDRLAADGPIPAVEVARIGAKIASALDAAHQIGIVHRDVKPSNILISRFGEPVLADFGVACLLDDQASATVLGTFTLRHAAPEVVNGGKPNAASDVYALGSTMYELLAGRPAFDGRGMEVLALMRRVLTEEPEPLTCPDLPPLAGVVARAMAKRPQDRYPSAAALAGALSGLLPGAVPAAPWQPAAAPAPLTDAPGGLPRTTPLPPDEAPDAPVPLGAGDYADTAFRPGRAVVQPVASAPARSGRRRTVLLTALGVVLVLGAASGVMFLRNGSDGGSHPVAAGPAIDPATQTSHPSTHATASAVATASAPSTVSQPTSSVTRPAVHGNPGPGPGPGPGPTGNPAPTTVQPPAPPPATSRPTTSAPPPAPSVCTTSGCAGRAYFVANGEHLFVCDQSPDGYGAVAKYTRTDVPNQNNIATNTGGSGTCIDHNMNMPEGSHITFSICLIKGGVYSRCSGWITARA